MRNPPPGWPGTKRQWRLRTEATAYCPCGSQATSWLRHGTALYGRCEQHADVPLESRWRLQGGRYLLVGSGVPDSRPAPDELAQLRQLLFQVALAVSNPDRDHFGRCIDVSRIVGSAEQWRPEPVHENA